MSSLFDQAPLPTSEFMAMLEKMGEPRSRYIIAMTPRSGSSYLCDVMTKTRRFGAPGEFLNKNFLPKILTAIPADNANDYLHRVFIKKKTPNGLSGLKTSWFQFEEFLSEFTDTEYLKKTRFIYLRRRDVIMQAISLYKATKTDVFHTNVEHGEEQINALKALEYDFKGIERWRQHILRQEQGWDNYFYQNRIFPLNLFYEEIEQDILRLMKRVATFVAVDPNNVQMPDEASVFRKVRDQRNMEWAERFAKDLAKKGLKLQPSAADWTAQS